jgi:hypothetical protein
VRAALHNPGYGSHRLLGSVERALSECQLCAVATHQPAGTVLFSFSDDLDLHFLSDPGSTHGQNIARGSSAAIAVYDSHQIRGDAHSGPQMFGICSLLLGAAEEEGRRLYARALSQYLEFAEHPARRPGCRSAGSASSDL